MIESLSFLLHVIAKDLYTILSSIKPQWILNLSVSTFTISTESGGNVAVDSFRVWSFMIKFSLFLQTLKNCFEISVYDKGNFELVLSALKPHEKILVWHVYPNRFIVYTIFKVLVPGLSLESLEAVQTEVIFVLMLTINASK